MTINREVPLREAEKSKGKLVISLDLELYWGIRDMKTLSDYQENLLGVWESLPNMLKIFDQYGVKATFASVGLLMLEDRNEIQEMLPDTLPSYEQRQLSPFEEDYQEIEDKRLYFGKSLIDQILQSEMKHEIASHTFSHYYALEEGQSADEFEADLIAFNAVCKRYKLKSKSLVFPRNQVNPDYFPLLKKHGIQTYRGQEDVWFQTPVRSKKTNPLSRTLRFLDAYINLSGEHCHQIQAPGEGELWNIPSSRFLRPYSASLSVLESLKIRRIKRSISCAARSGKVFHLWWHPHNFGKHQQENLQQLEDILSHFDHMRKSYGMESATMGSFPQQVEEA